MKEQHLQSDHEWEQMILDRNNILCEQKELNLLNQCLQTKVATLQNNSTWAEGDP